MYNIMLRMLWFHVQFDSWNRKDAHTFDLMTVLCYCFVRDTAIAEYALSYRRKFSRNVDTDAYF